MDNTMELIAELAAHLKVSRRQAKILIAKHYGVSERSVYNWIKDGGIYEYGLILQAVKTLKENNGQIDHFKTIKQRYHDYDNYDSSQERAVMMFFAFECVNGERAFKQPELSEKTGVPRSTLFKCIARLVEKGMLSKRNTDDGTGVIYKLQ